MRQVLAAHMAECLLLELGEGPRRVRMEGVELVLTRPRSDLVHRYDLCRAV